VYELGSFENRIFAVDVNRIGQPSGCFIALDGQSNNEERFQKSFPGQGEALDAAFHLLEDRGLSDGIHAISHRIVHGGSRYSAPQLITPQLMRELREIASIDPDHLPQAITVIESVSRRFPHLPQVVCFDTAFHRTMPRVAQLCPLPERYFDEGIFRYGFHGISYEYIMSELRLLDGEKADGRVVVAHLGNGASMAAIKNGRSLDTTMGFTSTSGLLMGTRSGDIDPGVLLYLLKNREMTVDMIDSLINKKAGLLGVSGISADMEILLADEDTNHNAADAIALFCYRAKKYLAAFVAVLGGLDILVFTAGIGEHAPVIRDRICSGLEILGIRVDPARNRQNAAVISNGDSRVTVRVMKTNENLMLARHAVDVLNRTAEPQRSH
jgi:acetate kinase